MRHVLVTIEPSAGGHNLSGPPVAVAVRFRRNAAHPVVSAWTAGGGLTSGTPSLPDVNMLRYTSVKLAKRSELPPFCSFGLDTYPCSFVDVAVHLRRHCKGRNQPPSLREGRGVSFVLLRRPLERSDCRHDGSLCAIVALPMHSTTDHQLRTESVQTPCLQAEHIAELLPVSAYMRPEPCPECDKPPMR